MPRPFAQPITLTDADRETLTQWARRPKTAQALALRVRIILAAAEPGAKNTAIARRLGVTMPTVTKWRNRFAARGLAGLHDEPRPGAVHDCGADRYRVRYDFRRWPRWRAEWRVTGPAKNYGTVSEYRPAGQPD